MLKADLSGIRMFNDLVVIDALIPNFPSPVRGFVYSITPDIKEDLHTFLNAYQNFLRASPGACKELLQSAPKSVNAINNNNNNNNNKKNKNNGTHRGGRFPRSKKKSNPLALATCYNCGKIGHSLFNSKCPKYEDVKQQIDNGVSKKTIIEKYRSAFDAHSVNSINHNLPTAPAAMRDVLDTAEEDIASLESNNFKTISILPNKNEDGSQPPAYRLTYKASYPKLDTCAGVTICNNPDLIHHYEEFDDTTSQLYTDATTAVGDHPIRIIGRGMLKIVAESVDGCSRSVVTSTLFAPDCGGTFISHEQLLNDGLEFRSLNRQPYLCWGKHEMLIGKNPIDNMPTIPIQHFVIAPHRVYGVHENYGHINRRKLLDSTEKGLIKLSEKERLELRNGGNCTDCNQGSAVSKQHKTGSRDKYLVRSPFFLVHSDLCQITSTKGTPVHGRYKYLATFMDNFSKFVFVSYLKTKDELSKQFSYFLQFVKTQFGKNVLVLMSDKGSEYLNTGFDEKLKSCGIIQRTTQGYDPQANGVAERLNSTLLSSIRTNLFSAGLPNKYWTEACDYVVALLNNVVVNPWVGDSPESFLRKQAGQDGYVSGFKFLQFGRMVNLHLQKRVLGKLDPRTTIAFYLGPAQTVLGGYKLLVPTKSSTILIEAKDIDTHCDDITYKDWLKRNNIIPTDPVADISVDYSLPTVCDEKTHANIPNPYRPVELLTLDEVKEALNVQNTLSLGGDLNLGGEETILQSSDDLDTTASTAPTASTATTNVPVEHTIEHDAEEKRLKVHKPDTVSMQLSTDSSISTIPEPSIVEQTIEGYEEVEHALNNNEYSAVSSAMVQDSFEEPDEEIITVPKKLRETYSNSTNIIRVPANRRFLRKRVNNIRFIPSAVSSLLINPKTISSISFKKALGGKDSDKWEEAINSHLHSLIKKDTWDAKQILTDDPHILNRTVKTKWVLDIKRSGKRKARLVARGDHQPDETISESFSPTMSYEVLRMILVNAVQTNKFLKFMDISSAYLNAPIDHEIYLALPQGVKSQYDKVLSNQSVVLKLKKAIFGLRQSSRLWYLRFTEYLCSVGFKQHKEVSCLLTYEQDGKVLANFGYFIDDCVISAVDEATADLIINKITSVFEATVSEKDSSGCIDMLGIKIKEYRTKSGVLNKIELNQADYITKLGARLGIFRGKRYMTPMTPNFKFDPHDEDNFMDVSGYKLSRKIKLYREYVGCLMYISLTTRPDLAFTSIYLSRFALYPHDKLFGQIRRAVNYLVASKNYKICYSNTKSKFMNPSTLTGYLEETKLVAFSDADLAGDVCSRKSTVACLFMIANGPVYWKTRAGEIVATSSTESELVGMVHAGKEFVYLLNVARILHMDMSSPHTCYVDNTSSITLAHTAACKGRTKHLGIMIAKANDLETEEKVYFKYIPTKDQLADILTKPVATTVMESIIKNILLV
ncbi:unnamed protein product [Ambrosiozyma monospora]|uniref:Unnamed protein product n=1 Tax=Ambrosiozyma monospora TaxID=43982 RepID=A0A9W7DIQ7_AMBMO|nr:unnamed protein product [Ambrosiozyma monospora]